MRRPRLELPAAGLGRGGVRGRNAVPAGWARGAPEADGNGRSPSPGNAPRERRSDRERRGVGDPR